MFYETSRYYIYYWSFFFNYTSVTLILLDILFKFHPFEVVLRYREPQLQIVKITHICLTWDQTLANFAV